MVQNHNNKTNKQQQQQEQNHLRHPSPIVYDRKAFISNENESSPQHSPEEKLYYDRQQREVEYKSKISFSFY